jgi:hypothetical protein
MNDKENNDEKIDNELFKIRLPPVDFRLEGNVAFPYSEKNYTFCIQALKHLIKDDKRSIKCLDENSEKEFPECERIRTDMLSKKQIKRLTQNTIIVFTQTRSTEEISPAQRTLLHMSKQHKLNNMLFIIFFEEEKIYLNLEFSVSFEYALSAEYNIFYDECTSNLQYCVARRNIMLYMCNNIPKLRNFRQIKYRIKIP